MENKVRDILAFMIVGGYVVVMIVLALVPPLFGIGEPNVIIEHMKTFGSLLTGTVGGIIGFYFGKGTAAR